MSRLILRRLSAAFLFAAIALLPRVAVMQQQKGGEDETGQIGRAHV